MRGKIPRMLFVDNDIILYLEEKKPNNHDSKIAKKLIVDDFCTHY